MEVDAILVNLKIPATFLLSFSARYFDICMFAVNEEATPQLRETKPWHKKDKFSPKI